MPCSELLMFYRDFSLVIDIWFKVQEIHWSECVRTLTVYSFTTLCAVWFLYSVFYIYFIIFKVFVLQNNPNVSGLLL